MYPIVSRSQPAHRDENDHRIELYCVNEAIVFRGIFVTMKKLTSRHTHTSSDIEIVKFETEPRSGHSRLALSSCTWNAAVLEACCCLRKVGQHEPNERLKASKFVFTIAKYASLYFWIWRSHCGRRFHNGASFTPARFSFQVMLLEMLRAAHKCSVCHVAKCQHPTEPQTLRCEFENNIRN